jgi:hypothetical protein
MISRSGPLSLKDLIHRTSAEAQSTAAMMAAIAYPVGILQNDSVDQDKSA